MQAELPRDWLRVSLGEALVNIVPGRSPATNNEVASGARWGVLKVSAIGAGVFLADENKLLPTDFDIAENHKVKGGDVIISRANTASLVGACCRVPEGSYRLMLCDKTLRLEPDGGRIREDFLSHVVCAPVARSYFTKAATGSSASMKNLSQSKIRALQVSLPPLEEQRKISEILSSVDETIQAIQAVIMQTRRVKEGLLQELLTKGIGHTQFKKTAIGEIPVSWESRTLGELADIQAGLSKPKVVFGSGCLVVMIQNLYEGSTIRQDRLRRIAVTDAEIEKYRLQPGDVLLGNASVKRTGIGYANKFDGAQEDVIFAKYAFRATNLQGLLPSYLFQLLRRPSTRRWLIARSQTGALTNLNKPTAQAIPIPLPPIEEQQEIVDILSSFDGNIENAQNEVVQTKRVKKGLLQDLLTGKVRVSV